MSAEFQTKVLASTAQNFTPVWTDLLQRKCTLCNTSGLTEDSKQDQELIMQRSCTDQAVTTTVRFGHDFSKMRVHNTRQGIIQTKLKISRPGDPYEQEADKVAEQVMRMEELGVRKQPDEEIFQTKPVTTPLIQRQTEEEEFLQAKELPGPSYEVTPALLSHIQSLKGGGYPLSETDRAFFEPRFGHDFSRVRVHTDTRAAETAQAVNARAFTVGQDVIFARGHYKPGTVYGKKLLAHELTHVIQQGKDIKYGSKPYHIKTTDLGEQISRSISIRGTNDYEEEVNEHLDQLRESQTGRNLYSTLDNHTVEINEVTGACGTNRVLGTVLVYYNRFRCPGTPNGNVPNSIYLGHELIHGLHRIEGTHIQGNAKEWQTVGFGRFATLPFTENRIRCEMGIPPRISYFNSDQSRYYHQGFATPRCVNNRYEHPRR